MQASIYQKHLVLEKLKQEKHLIWVYINSDRAEKTDLKNYSLFQEDIPEKFFPSWQLQRERRVVNTLIFKIDGTDEMVAVKWVFMEASDKVYFDIQEFNEGN